MPQTRTAKGTVATKASSTTLTLASVPMDAGTTLFVAVAWEDEGVNNKPTLTWGNKTMTYVVSSEASRGDTVLRWYKFRIKKNTTKDIVATWPTAKTAKAMLAVQVDGASVKDVQSTNNQANTTSHNTGTAVTTTEADTYHLAAFAMIGPSTDTAGTAGDGHTAGQRVGTSGNGAASNVTLQETFEDLAAIGDTRATLTLTTGRGGCSSIVAWKPVQTYTVNRAEYIPWDANPDQESVAFVMEDETTNELFQVMLPRREFEELSDVEVEDYIKNRCQWRADKDFDGAPSPDFTPDTAFNNRVASFVGDTFSV